MNRTIKEAAVKRFQYDNREQVRNHLANFISAYKAGRRLKTPKAPHALQVHLQTIDNRTRKLDPEPDPSNGGTENLERDAVNRPHILRP